MDVDELLNRAWNAVKKSGVPEALQPQAFKEAIHYLRSDASDQVNRDQATGESKGATSTAKAKEGSEDGRSFFARLAEESGVSQERLRDVLRLTDDGKVQPGLGGERLPPVLLPDPRHRSLERLLPPRRAVGGRAWCIALPAP